MGRLKAGTSNVVSFERPSKREAFAEPQPAPDREYWQALVAPVLAEMKRAGFVAVLIELRDGRGNLSIKKGEG